MTLPGDPDDLMAAALAAGKTQQQAADAAGVSRRTVVRRLTDPAFRDRVTQLRLEAVTRGLGILAGGIVGAVEQMIELCRHGKDESVRLRAAVAIADTCHRYWTEFDLAERLRRLEVKLGVAPPAG
jgi:hypothetical protein